MLPVWAVMAALTAAKVASDKNTEDRQRKLSAEQARYSPWSGMSADPIQQADPFGTAMQGGMTTMQMDQNQSNVNNQNDLMRSQKGWYDRGAGPSQNPNGPRY